MSKKVLICDDASFMRMILKDILTKEGYEIVGEAANGKAAISSYNTLRPDLVMMDITMPEMDGIEAVKGIKQIDPKALIVMCSALGQKEMVINAIKAGARDFVVKPFENSKIVEVVGNALAC